MMEDLKNNSAYSMYKIMWANEGENVIWDMKSETHTESCILVLELLKKYINIDYWVKNYSLLYSEWLKGNSNDIYNIKSDINNYIIKANNNFNSNEKYKLFYWFDVDRNIKSKFNWKKSPISGDKLHELDDSFSLNNRLISINDLLVFPKNI